MNLTKRPVNYTKLFLKFFRFPGVTELLSSCDKTKIFIYKVPSPIGCSDAQYHYCKKIGPVIALKKSVKVMFVTHGMEKMGQKG